MSWTAGSAPRLSAPRTDSGLSDSRNPPTCHDLVLGYLSVDFSFTDRPPLQVYLSVLVKRSTEDDLISHYQVSRLN
jgi:hypothetical protein